MEKTYSKKQMTTIGFVIAIVTAAIMIILQMFGVTTPSEKAEVKEEVKPAIEQKVVEKTDKADKAIVKEVKVTKDKK